MLNESVRYWTKDGSKSSSLKHNILKNLNYHIWKNLRILEFKLNFLKKVPRNTCNSVGT